MSCIVTIVISVPRRPHVVHHLSSLSSSAPFSCCRITGHTPGGHVVVVVVMSHWHLPGTLCRRCLHGTGMDVMPSSSSSPCCIGMFRHLHLHRADMDALSPSLLSLLCWRGRHCRHGHAVIIVVSWWHWPSMSRCHRCRCHRVMVALAICVLSLTSSL